jgi:hypothetical protein
MNDNDKAGRFYSQLLPAINTECCLHAIKLSGDQTVPKGFVKIAQQFIVGNEI